MHKRDVMREPAEKATCYATTARPMISISIGRLSISPAADVSSAYCSLGPHKPTRKHELSGVHMIVLGEIPALFLLTPMSQDKDTDKISGLASTKLHART